MENYPQKATENFDTANFHIKYCLYFIKKFLSGKILEVGAGCGSFTKNYINNSFQVTLTEVDKLNFSNLIEKFKKYHNVKIKKIETSHVEGKFNSIMYLHVLEHIEDDMKELDDATKKLENNGHLIIMAPAHKKIYGNLDRAVGHFRRYEKEFFKENLLGLKRKKLIFLDSIGYWLYYLNKIFFKNEIFPSKIKIFIWDKFFTPISIICDYLTNYKFGKCILAVYKKE